LAAYAANAIRLGSRSFARAASIFDRETRERAHLLYAWCRYCDDQVDGQRHGHAPSGVEAAPADARARLDSLERRTAEALRGGTVTDLPFQALQRVVAQCRIPEQYPLDLLAGFRMDVEGRRPHDLEELLKYCYHVAGVVGVMMAHVMGVEDEATLDRAADLGIAFQLTNIARDVRHDAAADRIYLPLKWLETVGLAPEAVGAVSAWPRIVPLVHRLLDEADRYYESALVGLRGLGLRRAWATAAALGIYRDIGRVVRRRGVAAWERRAVVSGSRKAYRVVWALGRAASAVTTERARPQASRAGLLSRPAPARLSL
jgi:phytoene synthase